jgi:hypothetical protein
MIYSIQDKYRSLTLTALYHQSTKVDSFKSNLNPLSPLFLKKIKKASILSIGLNLKELRLLKIGMIRSMT